MSGIAGLLRHDGAPAERRIVEAMTEAMRHRGPDAGGCWVSGSVGLGSRIFRSTPEASVESGPLRDAEHDLCLVFDGRVDNREELLRDLGAAGIEPRGMSDADLVLAAWRAWQSGMPRRILGDFALAIWDGRRRVLFCARDILGIRPFCYAAGAGQFAFASEVHQLFQDPALPQGLNEGMVGEYLACAINSTEDTLYAGVRRLPPAHWLQVNAEGRVRIERYWDVDFDAAIRHPRVEDYARQLRVLFEQATRSRLRAAGPVGTDLSGGVDSSAVSVLAHRLASGAPVHAFSMLYPGIACDESRYSAEVARHATIERIGLAHGDPAIDVFARHAARYRDFPGYPVATAFLASLAPEAAARGCRVMLSGEGGDPWFTGEADALADALLAPARLLRATGQVAAVESISPGRALLRHAFRPWLRRMAHATGWRRAHDARTPWIERGWAARVGLRDRLRVPQPRPHGGSRAQVAMYGWTMSGYFAHSYETGDRESLGAGIEYRHPLLDRHLIEFAFAVPQELHFAKGIGKSLLRDAVADLLPPSVLARGDKADFSVVACRAIDAALAVQPIADWPAARAGWVDPDVLMREYAVVRSQAVRGAPVTSDAIWGAWTAYAVGLVAAGGTGAAVY